MKAPSSVCFGMVVLMGLYPRAQGDILILNEVEGFLGSNKTQITTTHNGTTQINYDATGVDKLVIAIGTESGFNNQKVNSVNVSFNGDAFTTAVMDNFAPPGTAPFTNDGGIASILYLDNPFQGLSTFTVSISTTGGGANGGHVSILGLSGTEPGIGAIGSNWTSQGSAGTVSTSLSTTGNDSLVLAMVENSGAQSGAGTPTAVTPLTLSNNGSWGSQWGGAASGYQFVTDSGTPLTPSFQTNAGGSIHIVAVEFLSGSAIPEPSGLTLLAMAGLGMLAFRNRLKTY